MKKTILTMIALLGFSILSSTTAFATAQTGEQAPDFSLSTMDGKSFNLSDYKGKKPVYLIFWATWCPNCKHEIPEIKKIHSTYQDKMEIIAINVSINDSMKKVGRYIQKHKLPYSVAFDTDARVTRLYGVLGTPTQMIIDTQGIVRYRGTNTPDDLAEHFNALAIHE